MAVTTGASRKVVPLIQTKEDVKNWKYNRGDTLQLNRDLAVRA